MTDKRTVFTHTFTATEYEARRALCGIMTKIRAAGLAEEQIGGVEIVLAEVVNNIVEHAYHGLRPGDIVVSGITNPKLLELRITDGGKPLPGGRLPEGKPADVTGSVADLPEGGFGWFMIRTLARDIRYKRDKGCNILQISFDLIPHAE